MIQNENQPEENLKPVAFEDFDRAMGTWSTHVVSSSASAAAADRNGTSADQVQRHAVEQPTQRISTSERMAEAQKIKKPKAKRGLNRVKPKTDAVSVRRRKRLETLGIKKKSDREFREENDVDPSGEVIAAISPPAVSVNRIATKLPVAGRTNTERAKLEKTRNRKTAPPTLLAFDPLAPNNEIPTTKTVKVRKPSKMLARKRVVSASARRDVSRAKPTSESPEFATTLVGMARGDSHFALTEPPPPVEETYSEWFQRVIVRNKWMTWFTTFYFHWLLILALAAFIVNGPENTASMLINAAFAEEIDLEPPPFEVITEPEPQETDTEQEESVAVEEVPAKFEESAIAIDESLMEELLPESEIAAASKDVPPNQRQNEITKPTPQPVINPAPHQAVSQGSFSVWTEPSQPVANEPYRIIIQIRLPEGLERYNVGDLQGVVVGSDGYRKPIPGLMRGFLPVEDGYCRLIVPIVSADAQVQDTVFIRSRILKETQKLLLEF